VVKVCIDTLLTIRVARDRYRDHPKSEAGNGTRYRVVGPRLFDYPNSLSGLDHKLYWIRVEATDG
jgi:hypothetical protein